MTFLSPTRMLRSAAVVGVALTATLAASPAAEAQQTELAVNALAPQITKHAELAVEAFVQYAESDDIADYLLYAQYRTATARLAARQLGYDEFEMIDAWSDSSLDHQRAVLAAMTQIGVPYRSHSSLAGEGFDCSGLTSYAWGKSGVELNRISGDQIRAATKVDREAANAGDLVHYPGHVMLYLGVDDAVVHSVNTGRTVEIDTISHRRVSSVTFGNPID